MTQKVYPQQKRPLNPKNGINGLLSQRSLFYETNQKKDLFGGGGGN